MTVTFKVTFTDDEMVTKAAFYLIIKKTDDFLSPPFVVFRQQSTVREAHVNESSGEML